MFLFFISLLHLNVKLSSSKLSRYSDIWRAFGAIMYLLEPKEGGGRRNVGPNQGVTKRCRLSWLTNSALVYEPKCGGRVGVAGSQPMSTAVHRSPNKLCRSNSIFSPLAYNLTAISQLMCFETSSPVWKGGYFHYFANECYTVVCSSCKLHLQCADLATLIRDGSHYWLYVHYTAKPILPWLNGIVY